MKTMEFYCLYVLYETSLQECKHVHSDSTYFVQVVDLR